VEQRLQFEADKKLKKINKTKRKYSTMKKLKNMKRHGQRNGWSQCSKATMVYQHVAVLTI